MKSIKNRGATTDNRIDRDLLKPGLMITSIIGLVISISYTVTGEFERIFSVYEKNLGTSLGFSAILVFLIMFVASFVMITPREKELRMYK